MLTLVMSSATFWWITELANRVSASRWRSTETSTSAPGSAAVVSVERGGGKVELGGHARTPTRTLRKRAGAAGCPVCPIWPGWPLPQLGVPHASISDESMSIDDQN